MNAHVSPDSVTTRRVRYLDRRRPHLFLAADRRHGQVQGLRDQRRRRRGRRGRDRHRGRAPREPDRSDPAAAGRLHQAGPLHLSAQHGGLLHRRRRRAHPAPGPRGRRLGSGEAGGAVRPQDPLSRHGRDPALAEAAGRRGLPGDGLLLGRPGLRRKLEEAGAVAIMPLGAPIGSGLGIQNRVNLRIIVENAGCRCWSTPGVGTASDARSAWSWAATPS
jgi:hypothetical protein